MKKLSSKREVKRYQEFLMNSWPAKHYYFLNGWVLRFTEGVTYRANSVFPIRYTGTKKTLDVDIDFVEKAYNAYELPPIFTMPEYFEPKFLQNILEKRGYYSFDHTITLGLEINEIQVKNVNSDFEYLILDSRVKEFSELLANFSKRNEQEQEIIQKINQRIIIPKKCYILVKYEGEIIGTLFAVLIPQGYMYVGDVFVHPDHRRRQVATSMLGKLVDKWKVNEVKYIWLQVEKDNFEALNLYYKLGMKKLYDYFYMKPDR